MFVSAVLALAAIGLDAQVTSGQQPDRTITQAASSGMPTTDPDKMIAFDWIDAHSEAVNKLSLDIWDAAELSFREFKSSRALISFLESNGFSVEKGIGGMTTAFVASYGSGKPVIVLFGEYDALAGMSQKAQPIRESLLAGAPGHACGHNLIGASTAAAAASVAKIMHQRNIKGTLRFYGTPAEETGSGKDYMLGAGAFKDVDILLGWHPNDRTRVTFEYSKAVAEMHFKFTGVAAHASIAPYLGRSALHGVELMDSGVNFMREQLNEDARIHYVITKGGGSPNVIPPEAESWYFIRANKNKDVLDIFEWVSEIAKGAAMMTRTQVEINVDSDNHEVLPNRPLAETVDRNLHSVGAPKFNYGENTEARKMQEGMKGNFKFPFAPNIPVCSGPSQALSIHRCAPDSCLVRPVQAGGEFRLIPIGLLFPQSSSLAPRFRIPYSRRACDCA